MPRASPEVHVFWDNSNIFVPAGYVARHRDGTLLQSAVRIQFDNLYDLAGRAASRVRDLCRFCSTSCPDKERPTNRVGLPGQQLRTVPRPSPGCPRVGCANSVPSIWNPPFAAEIEFAHPTRD